jgi:hypothetical protein
MNNMDSLSFYNDDPVFASPLNNDEFMLLEDDTERDALLDQEDVFMKDVQPLSTPEPLEIDDVRSPPTAATRDDHIKPSISTWAFVRINPERFVPPPEAERSESPSCAAAKLHANPVGNTQRFALVGLCAPRHRFKISVGLGFLSFVSLTFEIFGVLLFRVRPL